MLTKKFYLPSGALIVAIVAIAFFALRSDTAKEPITIYKPVTPTKRSLTPTTPTVEARTISASMSKEETIEETPVSTSEVPMSYLLSEFPDYETMNSVGQGVARELARLRWEGENRRAKKAKILAELRAGNADLKRKIAEQEAAKELRDYFDSTMLLLNTEYADVEAFSERCPDAQETDFIREYPDETERNAFYARTLEAAKIRKELVDRILATPGIPERLPPTTLEILRDTANAVSIDEISAALEILRSKGVSE